MNITGKNLEIVRHATELALMEVHNQIGTCPDARMYADDIAALKQDRIEIEGLLARVCKALEKERSHEVP